jgi:hypothetical protein
MSRTPDTRTSDPQREELKAKYRYLLHDERPRAVAHVITGRDIQSITALAAEMGITHSNLYPASGHLSPLVVAHLQRIYQIDPNSECWGEFIEGDAKEFAKEFAIVHPATSVGLEIATTDRHNQYHGIPVRQNYSQATKTEFIYQLAKKIDILSATMFEMAKLPTDSRTALANFAHIPPSDLDSACASGSASRDLVRALTNACMFDASEVAWNDLAVSPSDKQANYVDYHGRDTAEAFRRHLRTVWELPLTEAVRLRGSRPRTLDPNLASFALSDAGQETQLDQPIVGAGRLRVRLQQCSDSPCLEQRSEHRYSATFWRPRSRGIVRRLRPGKRYCPGAVLGDFC